MSLISIILPVYNAVSYIENTLKSLLNQSYKEFELIIIDDGATDGTSDICENYANLDNRIKLYRKKNGGICSARNYGLKKASGEWIAFCDHDDIYDRQYLEKSYYKYNQLDVDLIKFEYHSIGINEYGHIFMDQIQYFDTTTFSLEELVCDYEKFNQCIRVLWNGLYRTKIIKKNSLKFDESIKLGMEDYAFNISYLSCSKKVKTIHECLYTHYTRNKQSAFTKFSSQKLEDIIKVSLIEKEFLSAYNHDKNITFTQFLHDAIYLSIFLEQMSLEGNSLTMQQKKIFLKKLKQSGAMFNDSNIIAIAQLYRNNWKYALKLNLFKFRAYRFLIAYQQLNNKRKGR